MADEDAIREAFSHIKQDIVDLKREIYFLKREIIDLKARKPVFPTDIQQTNQHTDSTQHIIGQDKPYLLSSIGNDGVPTDKQTDNKQTNRQASEPYFNAISLPKTSQFPDDKIEKSTKTSDLINLVTNLKEEMRQNFLKLTRQEFLIFSVVYSLDDEGIQVTYPLVAEKTRLSESSIRDYIARIVGKGIPLEKHKINNKQVIIRVKDELKSLATLDSLVKLREFGIDET
jgi:hypothetical protein